MRPDEISLDIEIPDGTNVNLNGKSLEVKGKKGELRRDFKNPKVNIKVESNKVTLISKKPSKKEKNAINTYRAHIQNMIKGSNEPFKYELKICSTHFPMNVSFNNGELVVKNFYGEKYPRKLKIDPNVTLKVNDKMIELESCDKEIIGLTASNIEQLTRITNKDLRIFQDGIYIVKKGDKEIKTA
jgi:large subunit ribosomal protein L6